MNIIGLGSAGCNIADGFSKYPQYTIYKIDEGIKKEKGKHVFSMPKRNSPEEYEESVPDMSSFFKGIKKGDEVLFVVGGTGKISGASLKILWHIRHATLDILYIRPDVSLAGQVGYLQDRTVMGVFQEYARSGVFRCLYLTFNKAMESIIGSDNITMLNHYDKLNELLVATIHSINVSKNTKAIQGARQTPYKTSRIASFGIVDMSAGKERFFYPIENVREIEYYYVFGKKSLTNLSILNKVKDRMKERQEVENWKVSYLVHTSEQEYDVGYCVAYSRLPQTV